MPKFVNINEAEDNELWINISEIVAVMQSGAHTRVTCRGDEGMVYLGTRDCKAIMYAIAAWGA